MLTFFSAIIASVLHVISGPDHIAAVTPMAIYSQKRSWIIGLLWGLGHVLGMFVIGVLFLVFKELIPLELISSYSEQLVAVVLIAVGIYTFYRIYKDYSILNSSAKNESIDPKLQQKTSWSSFGIGVLHGLAGVAHFILFLPVASFDTQLQSVLYIVGFVIGTLLAMTIVALILGRIALYSKQPKVFFLIRFFGGLFAIIVGVYWMYLSL